MKKIALLLSVLALLGLFTACGSKTEYRDDLKVSNLSGIVEGSMDKSSLAEMNSGYLSGAMHLDPSIFADYVVKINAYGVNIDEYGIFKARTPEEVADVKEAVEGYLQLRKDAWMDEYMPEEKPKLENAEIKVCGRYVMYVIMDDDTRQSALNYFESALTVKK